MAASWSLKQLAAVATSSTENGWIAKANWDVSAPGELAAAAKAGDWAALQAAWCRDLQSRREAGTTVPKALFSAWSIPGRPDDPLLKLVRKLGSELAAPRGQRPTIKARSNWQTRIQPLVKALTASHRPAVVPPVATLAALELLWASGDRLSPDDWQRLWRQTLVDLALLQAQPVADQELLGERLIRQGEIPLLAGLVYRHLSGSSDWLRKSQKALNKALTDHTDNDGTPHGDLLPQLTPWLAPLIRATLWTEQAGQSLWDEDAHLLLSDVAERAVALCRPGGQLALTNDAAMDALPILNQAADLFRWSSVNPSRACLKSLANAAAGRVSRGSEDAISVMPSSQSDWARVALLRTDWTAAAASVAIAHHQPLPQLDVTIGGQRLIHGAWDLDVRLGAAGIELAEEWNCVCWESQPDVDFAELQMEGPGNLRVERLILLSRTDHFLLLADSISGAPAGPLAIQSRLPLAPGVQLLRDTGRRSAWLEQGKSRVRLLPLSLPLDTVQSTPHVCELQGQHLVLEQRAVGQGLFAPLVFDFHPQRRRRELAWAKLTVTEEGRVVPGDIAMAYRWKLGAEQWLMYRSLFPPKVPRAALGHHTGHGFTVGRFDSQGNVDPLLTVSEED